MADPTCDIPNENRPPPSPTRSSQLQHDLRQEGDEQPSQIASLLSSMDDPTPDNFARTRSPLFIDQTDQAANYRHPTVENAEDTESDSYSPPRPRRISPFAADFMSTDTETSVFAKRKTVPSEQLPEAPIDPTKSSIEPELQSASSQDEYVVPESGSRGGSPKSAICLEDTTKQKIAEEISENGYAVTEGSEVVEKLNTNEHLVSTNLQDTKVIKEPVTPPGILTILDEKIDQQFSDTGYTWLEPDSTDSSSLTIFVPDASEEAQSLWTPDLCEALPELAENTTATGLNDHPDTYIDHTEEANEQKVDNKKNGLDKEHGPVIHEPQVPHDPSFHCYRIISSTEDAATSPQQHANEQKSESVVPKSPESPSRAIGYTSVLIDSPDGSEKITFQPSIQQSLSVQPSVPVNLEGLLRTQDREGQSQNNEASAQISKLEKHDLHHWKLSRLPREIFHDMTPYSSDVSSGSNTHCDNDSRRTSPEVEDISSPSAPDQQLAQTQILINQTLQDFKIDLLHQVESVIQESTKALIPAKNSAAAMILARPSPLQMEETIKVSINNAQEEITNTIEISKAEAIGCTLRTTEITKENCTVMAEALKKKILEHVDDKLGNLENMIVAFNTEHSTQGEAHLKSVLTDLLPPESLTALKQLPGALEQVKTSTATSSKEVVKQLEQYAAKADAVSNLCTRLDETITSKQPLQNEIVNNLYNILNQSTLQNNAINNLAAAINPLAKLVKGVSYDTSLIDGKLAKNADILVSITDRAEAPERAAERLSRMILDAESKFMKATTKVDLIATTASTVNGADAVQRFEALQGQMTTMQAQLDQIAAALAKNPCATDRGTGNLSDPPPPSIPNERSTNPKTPASNAPSTQIRPPSLLTFTITASFRLRNHKLLHAPTSPPTTLPITESNKIPTILSNFRSLWTRTLISQGVNTAEMQLVAIWISSDEATGQRVVDNEMAYRGWYDAVSRGVVKGGVGGGGFVLHFEFIENEDGDGDGDGEGAGKGEPKCKKRKQGEVRRGEVVDVRFGLEVWRNARLTRFERGGGYVRMANRGV